MTDAGGDPDAGSDDGARRNQGAGNEDGPGGDDGARRDQSAETADETGWRDPEWDDPDPGGFDAGPAAVGVLVALAGGLFLLEPLVGGPEVGGVAVRPFVLSAGVLGLAFALGAAVFWRRAQRTVALAHLVGAGGWLALFAAASLGSGLLVTLGLAVVVGGAVAMVLERTRQ